MPHFLQKILPYLLAFLFAFLPLHALGTTSFTHFFLEAGSPTPIWLKMWKEVLILIIFVIIGVLGFVGSHAIRPKHDEQAGVCNAPLQKNIVQKFLSFFKNCDLLDYLIISFTALALVVSALQYPENSLTNIAYGIKYTIFPLWIFFIFRRVSPEISEKFLNLFQKIFPYLSGKIIFLGLIFFFLAQYNTEFFTFLGYSAGESFHSIFQPLSYCQQISFTEICRAQSVFSGPNQLGAYLIFLSALLGAYCFRPFLEKKGDHEGTPLRKIFFWILFLSGVGLLFLTFSRSAWIGGVFSGLFFLMFFSKTSWRIRRKIVAGVILIPVVLVGMLSVLLPEISHKIITRASSSSQHYELSLEAAKHVLENPFGQGIGSAGAASKYASEEGKKEVGIIPENWYLQIGIETGLVGIFFWLGIIFLVMRKLVQKNNIQKNVETRCTVSLQNISKTNFPLGLAAAIFGISIMGIFLHSWESSAVAYTVWGLAGLVLRK